MPAKKKAVAKKKTAAKKVQAKKGMPPGFPSDQECIEQRRKSAEKEAAEVSALEVQDDFYGSFHVSSTQWPEPYLVEIRVLSEHLNSCSCQDYQMNRLGTCKHILRVWQFLREGRKGRFDRAAKQPGPFYEVFFDPRTVPPVLRQLPAAHPSAAAERVLDDYFGADGSSIGDPCTAFAAVQQAVKQSTPAARKKIRVTGLSESWMQRDAFTRGLKRMRKHFEQDVASGKRSDNPVNLPLYRYQITGMKHLVFSGRALLADEMGLGKTVQAIAAAQLLAQLGLVRKVLVVCPASLKAEWEDQLMQFAGREATLLYGLRPKRLEVYTEPHDFLVTNYEQVRNDVDDINRLYAPDLVILDEAQRIKNWPTKTAKTIKRLASPYAFVLTGTPLENRIEELYSLVEFIDPQVFGSIERFQRTFMELDEEQRVRPKNLPELHRQVSSVMLRRRKAEVEDSLPTRTDKNFYVPMSPEQWKRYQEHATLVAQLVHKSRRRSLSPAERDQLMINLSCMRMTCDTGYILDPTLRACPKLDELEAILDELLSDPKTKIIMFSEWLKMLDLVIELMTEKGLEFAEHTGRIPQAKRREEIRRFKSDPACRVFLSSESGGAGLNLQVADTVINLDLPWNPAKLEQRIARAWRKHQTRKVRVINLISEGTIESAMVDKLAYKTALANAVLDGVEMSSGAVETKAFADRIGELMGLKTEVASEPQDHEQAVDLQARFKDQILGIETHPASGRSLVIARTEKDAERIRTHGAGADFDVLDDATWHTLQRLAEQGLVSLSPDLENTFSSDGYQTPRPPTPLKKMNLRKAKTYWEAHAAERTAAATLMEVKLGEQAMPHLRSAVEAAVIALAILHAVHPRQRAEQVAAERCGVHANLVRSAQDWLGVNADAEAAQALLEQVAAVFE